MTSIEHIGIAVADIEKYIEIFTSMGGKVTYRGIASEFEAECVFIKFDNTEIELIKGTVPGNHICRFVEKRGNAIHHIAINGKGEKLGAKPGMSVSFRALDKTGNILIEEVDYSNTQIIDGRRGIEFIKDVIFVGDYFNQQYNIRIENGCTVGVGSKIFVNTIIQENTTIGKSCIIGNNTMIRNNVTIGNETKIGAFNSIEPHAKIGDRTRTQSFCMISEYSQIGNDVFIGPHVNNPADNTIGKPDGEYKPKPAIIEDGCRIGSGVIITPNHTIKKGTIVGAGSLVTKTTGEGELWYGAPAIKKQ